MIDAIAFLPVNDVALGVAYLRQNMHPHPRAVELLDYFDDTYVRGTMNDRLRAANRPAQRNAPLFPPALWNVHTATLNDNPRTNNVCESWNNAFFYIVGHNHPSMWNCVTALQRDHASEERLVQQDALGQHPRQYVKPALVDMQG